MQLEKGIFSIMDMQPLAGHPWSPLMQYDEPESAAAYAAQLEFHWKFPVNPPNGKWTYVNGAGGYAWKVD
jgi:hypothetical protein